MLGLFVGLATAVAMDAWAGFVHHRVWHASLWRIHRTHHRKRRQGRFELNDLMALVHAPPAIALIAWGTWAAGPLAEVALGIGWGMTAFGAAYLVFHDGVMHGRLPVGFLRRIRAVERICAAHEVHHRNALGGAPYSFFFGPRELLRKS